jgi:hypothetical protein
MQRALLIRGTPSGKKGSEAERSARRSTAMASPLYAARYHEVMFSLQRDSLDRKTDVGNNGHRRVFV